MTAHKTGSTSDILSRIAAEPGDHITLGRLVDDLSDAGFAILLFLFALPMALPLPATGLGTLLALPIILASGQLVMGRTSLWLPQKLRQREISLPLIRKAIAKVLPVMTRVEHLIHPRFTWCAGPFGHRLVGAVCSVCALAVALPFPLTNTIPSMGICVMAIGLLERDGLVSILGMLLGLAGCALAALAYYIGLEALKELISVWM